MLLVHSYVSQLSTCHNTPEEDDETMNTEERRPSSVHKLDPSSSPDGHPSHVDHTAVSDDSTFSRLRWTREQEHLILQTSSSLGSSQPPRSFPAGYSQPTPFPSQASWPHSSLAGSWLSYPNSLPSCLSQKDYPSCSEEECLSRYKSLSLPSQHSTNLSSFEQPMSLHSNPPSAEFYHHTLSPYSCLPQGPPCCGQCPADAFSRRHLANNPPWPQYHPVHRPFCESAHVFLNFEQMTIFGNWH